MVTVNGYRLTDGDVICHPCWLEHRHTAGVEPSVLYPGNHTGVECDQCGWVISEHLPDTTDQGVWLITPRNFKILLNGRGMTGKFAITDNNPNDLAFCIIASWETTADVLAGILHDYFDASICQSNHGLVYVQG